MPDRHAFFSELGAYGHDRYGPDVWSNASALVRRRVVGPGAHTESVSGRRRLRRLVDLAALAARTMWLGRGFDSAVLAGGAPVLLFAPYARADYDGLFLPILAALAASGVRCTVLTGAPSARRWSAHARDGAFDVGLLEAYASPSVYLVARAHLRTLRPAIADLSARFARDARQRAALREFFVAYAYQKALFEAALRHLAPRVVLGVHFLTGRGYQAAIREGGPGHRPLPLALLQHGGFTIEETRGFHDFEGADLVLLWGERWRRELARFASLPFSPTPTAIVVGNPKYDGREGRGEGVVPSEGERAPSRQRIVYMSTFVPGGMTDATPLAQAIAATRHEQAVDLLVKPHPLERLDHIRSRVAVGDLQAAHVSDARTPARTVIRDADVVVGPPSTTLFEAAYARRPVVLLSDRPPPSYAEFLHARGDEELRTILRRLRSDASWREAIVVSQERMAGDVFGPPGSAASRAADALRGLMARSEGGPGSHPADTYGP